MGIVETEYFKDENGVKMKKDIYANGMTITGLANESEPELQPITEQEQIAIDTALTVEYMACLLEANLG